MTKKDYRLELWDVQNIVPYPSNAKRHSEDQVSKLAKSIADHGWTQPIAVDETGTILAGHGRRLAALKLGLETVPVMIREGLSESQKRACRIADNTLASLGTFDFEALGEEIRLLWDAEDYELDLGDLGLDGFNFHLDAELAEIPSPAAAPASPAPESPEEDESEEIDYSKPDLSREKRPLSLFQVVVTAKNEDEQREVYDLLKENGWDNLRILTI